MDYTKGEWKTLLEDGGWLVTTDKDDGDICDCDLAPNQIECEANAQLIASAPDLYEACKNLARFERPKDCDCADMFDHMRPCFTCSYKLMLKALAKAEGKCQSDDAQLTRYSRSL